MYGWWVWYHDEPTLFFDKADPDNPEKGSYDIPMDLYEEWDKAWNALDAVTDKMIAWCANNGHVTPSDPSVKRCDPKRKIHSNPHVGCILR